MESSVQSLEDTKQSILDDPNKNEVSCSKMTATTLYAGIFYYLGQSLEQLFANKQNVLSKNTDATMRQVSCTDLTVAGANIISAINLKQNIIDSTKDIQMRNLTCNSVEIAGTDVISLLSEKQDVIQEGDLTILSTMGLQKTLDDFSEILDTKRDILQTDFSLITTAILTATTGTITSFTSSLINCQKYIGNVIECNRFIEKEKPCFKFITMAVNY